MKVRIKKKADSFTTRRNNERAATHTYTRWRPLTKRSLARPRNRAVDYVNASFLRLTVARALRGNVLRHEVRIDYDQDARS